MKLAVYVAGPYTGDEEANVERAIDAATVLRDLGFVPFVPHFFHFWEARHPAPYETWMEMDLFWLECCDALFRMPGESKGATREVLHAMKHNIPVFRTVEALVTWRDGR